MMRVWVQNFLLLLHLLLLLLLLLLHFPFSFSFLFHFIIFVFICRDRAIRRFARRVHLRRHRARGHRFVLELLVLRTHTIFISAGITGTSVTVKVSAFMQMLYCHANHRMLNSVSLTGRQQITVHVVQCFCCHSGNTKW